jgi:hypothetical protein
MSDVTLVCVTCGKEKIYPSFEYAQSKGWTLGHEEYCSKCKPQKPIPRTPNKPAIWYKFHWYICLLSGNRHDNDELDCIRRGDKCFMTHWNRQERSETWVEDTMVHWHLFPAGFSWEKYRTDRDTWLKYNASVELRARNYWYIVFTFGEHRHLLSDYWTSKHLQIF